LLDVWGENKEKRGFTKMTMSIEKQEKCRNILGWCSFGLLVFGLVGLMIVMEFF